MGASFAELLPVPDGILPQDRKQRGVEGNRPAFSGLCLALAHQIALPEFDLRPSKCPQLGTPNADIQRKRECQVNMGEEVKPVAFEGRVFADTVHVLVTVLIGALLYQLGYLFEKKEEQQAVIESES